MGVGWVGGIHLVFKKEIRLCSLQSILLTAFTSAYDVPFFSSIIQPT